MSGGPLRRSHFGKMSAWLHAVESIGMSGLHFHDLRHTGNTFASESKAGLKDLMARMGHDSERAAMIYQHKARGAVKALGVPAEDAQVILGHAHVSTAQQIYTHVDEAVRLDAISRLNTLLGGDE